MFDTEVYQRDLEYERSKNACDILCKEEVTRQSRLRILLLENENDDLHQQLAQDDSRIDSLECGTQELLNKVENLQADLLAANAELRIRNRELDNLKVRKRSSALMNMC